jgi:Flp pilus assembly protein TadG
MDGRYGVARAGIRVTATQRGQMLVWTAVMLPLFLSVVGLSIDGGIVFAARRELQNAADAAARAGAMQIDEALYRESSGATVALDRGRARAVAAEYLSGRGNSLTASITVEPERLVVQVSREVPTGFVRLVGIRSVAIAASASGEVRHGIERGSR